MAAFWGKAGAERSEKRRPVAREAGRAVRGCVYRLCVVLGRLRDPLPRPSCGSWNHKHLLFKNHNDSIEDAPRLKFARQTSSSRRRWTGLLENERGFSMSHEQAGTEPLRKVIRFYFVLGSKLRSPRRVQSKREAHKPCDFSIRSLDMKSEKTI